MGHDFDRSRLAVGAGDLWEEATRARFLDAVGDGTLPEEAFDRWLVQDYRFVSGLSRFVALTVAKTPREAQRVVIGGLAALDEELEWFEDHAEERGLDLDAEPHPVCRRYVDYLIAAGYGEPMEVLLAILYGVEVAYTVGWGRLEAEGPYAEFIERWTHPDFQAYVAELRDLADAHRHPDQQEHFDRVMEHERAFWRMTWEG
ncbi:MAG: TenA family transcriptional regulator [Gemmatimonadota bacterium]|nr:TenA family transcriptional regulator [Gemmatimonadota bacterium]